MDMVLNYNFKPSFWKWRWFLLLCKVQYHLCSWRFCKVNVREISECRDLLNLNMGCCGIWELLMTQHQLWPPVVGTLTLDLISYAPFIHTVAMLIITELLFSFNCFVDFLLFKTLAVHDCQLVEDIPVEKLLIHDVPVDIICTPDQVIFTNTNIPKPQGLWITAARSLKSEVYCSFFRVCFIKQPCNGFRLFWSPVLRERTLLTCRDLLGQIVSWEACPNSDTQRAQEQNWKGDRAETSLWSIWETTPYSSEKTKMSSNVHPLMQKPMVKRRKKEVYCCPVC